MRHIVLFVGVTLLLVSCSDSSPSGDGDCSSNNDCIAGQVCVSGACHTLCTGDASCDSRELCNAQGYCEVGTRPNVPEILSIDGDGRSDGAADQTAHHIDRDILISGTNLEGVEATLSNGAGDEWILDICSNDGQQIVAGLPQGLMTGTTYLLTVANQAGSSCAQMPVLQGEQGPAGPAGADGAPASMFTNVLINGGFEIWQRGSQPDMWATSGVEGSFTKETTDVSGGAVAMRFDTTNPAVYAYTQMHELDQYRGETLTFSLDVKNDSGLTPYLVVDDGVASVRVEHSGSGSYERLNATFVVAPTATKLVVRVYVNSTNSTGGVLVDNAMMVLGSASSVAYVPGDMTFEWQRCLRYYEAGTSTGTGWNDHSENLGGDWVTFAAPKAPGVVFTSSAARFYVWGNPYSGSTVVADNVVGVHPDPGSGPVLDRWAYDATSDGSDELVCTVGSAATATQFSVRCEIGGDWQVTTGEGWTYAFQVNWVAEVPILDP